MFEQVTREADTRELERFFHTRNLSTQLASYLSPEDQVLQSMPDASPTKWHLAHTSWFFETFILQPYYPDYQAANPHYAVLFNSYYQAVGPQFKRAQRGMLSRPSVDEVLSYRQYVDEHIEQLLTTHLLSLASETKHKILTLLELGINHEQQHQELLLTDIKHALSMNPMRPAFLDNSTVDAKTNAAELQWLDFVEGIYRIGHTGDSFCFDNELPLHKQYVGGFKLASRPVSNAEYLAFIEADGYQDPAHWLSEGWAWVQENQISHPLYWQQQDDEWTEFSLCGQIKLDPAKPACHISYYEADAYAKWAGKRLPTEIEWEVASHGVAVTGNLLDVSRLHPQPSAADKANSLLQMFGDVWEWTSSPYTAYPGFRIADGAVGEYNGKFMVNQMVLRGGSCATPVGHIRGSYRNFFPAHAQWQFSGIRLADDL